MAGPIRISVLADAASAKREFDSVSNSAGGLGKKFATFGKVAAAGVAVAGVAAVKFGADAVKSLTRIETINAQTAQAIKSTGGAAGVSAGHVERLAGRLENMTASEAEATQEGANLLLTFTNIRNEAGKGNAIFDRTTRAMVDMSRALGTDAKSSALQLGKALNDPIKGVSALSRSGVSFTQAQKDTIATMVETGRTMDAQKLILSELDKQFGGSGKAFAETTQGKIELAKHAFGTLGETVTQGLLPPLGRAATAVTEFLTYLNDNVGPAFSAASAFVTETFGPAFDKVKEIVRGFTSGTGGEVTGWAADIKSTFKDLVTIVTSLWDTFGSDIVEYATAALKNIKQIVGGGLDVIAGLFKTISALMKGDWGKAWEGIKQIVSGAKDVIAGVVKQLFNILQTVVSAGWKVIKGLFSTAWDGLKELVSNGIDRVVEFVTRLPGRITSAVSGAFDGLKEAFRSAVNFIIDGWNGLSFSLPGFDPPGPGPKFGGITIGTPNIPRLAAGGITTGPTLALVGDNPGGREAVIPLDRYDLSGAGDLVPVLERLIEEVRTQTRTQSNEAKALARATIESNRQAGVLFGKEINNTVSHAWRSA